MTLTKSYNALIQSTNCTVPGFLDLLGQARTNATVTLWSAESLSAGTPTYRAQPYRKASPFWDWYWLGGAMSD